MKDFLVRLMLAALAVVAFALAGSAGAESADEKLAASGARQEQPSANMQLPQPASAPFSNDPQTQEALRSPAES